MAKMIFGYHGNVDNQSIYQTKYPKSIACLLSSFSDLPPCIKSDHAYLQNANSSQSLHIIFFSTDQESCARVISCSLALHRNLLSVSDELVQLNVADSTQVETTPEEAVFQRAVVLLSCASYRNEILHVFVRPALLALAIQNANSHSKGERNAIYNLQIQDYENISYKPAFGFQMTSTTASTS